MSMDACYTFITWIAHLKRNHILGESKSCTLPSILAVKVKKVKDK